MVNKDEFKIQDQRGTECRTKLENVAINDVLPLKENFTEGR